MHTWKAWHGGAAARGVGAGSMTAREALDLMAEALSAPAAAAHAVLALATFDWSTARAQLPILSSPTYQRLGNGRVDPAKPERAAIDLGLLIRKNGIENARATVLELVIEEVSRVLRMPKDQISLVNPLAQSSEHADAVDHGRRQPHGDRAGAAPACPRRREHGGTVRPLGG